MEFSELVVKLGTGMQKDLPGRASQLKMSSAARIRQLIRITPSDDARQSSVLLLLYPLAGKVYFVLMLRPEYRGIHSGQISLPGGKSEETDDSLIYTALREAREEIGIDPSKVQILGQLTEMFIPPSNFIVTPVVGYQASRPEFRADPKEVAGIIEIALDDLLDDNNRQMKKIKLSMGLTLKVPAYCINGHVIWGATAMILSEFRDVVMRIMQPAD